MDVPIAMQQQPPTTIKQYKGTTIINLPKEKYLTL